MFMESYDNMEKLEQKYHKKRLYYQYPNITKFIINFANTNKLSSKPSNTNENEYNGSPNKSTITSFSAR
jgi:hypothetical protein